MKRLPLFLVALLFCGRADGALISGPDIIAAPADVRDEGLENLNQQAFDEAQSVLLSRDIMVDSGLIEAGTLVSSHMIFLNSVDNVFVKDFGVVWEFDGPILGVMSDKFGTLEIATSDILGASGTVYPTVPFNGRGIGSPSEDSYVVDGDFITVNMQVRPVGDWMRVVTAAPIPEPATLALFGLGAAGVGLAARRRRRRV